MTWTTAKRREPVLRKSPDSAWPLRFASKADTNDEAKPDKPKSN